MAGSRRALTGAILLALITLLSPFASAHLQSVAGPGTPISSTGVPAPTAFGPAAIPHALPVSAASGAAIPPEDALLHAVRASGAPSRDVFLPDLAPRTTRLGNVNVPLYPSAPAPVGIGAFGVINTTGTPRAEMYESPSFDGQLTLNSASVFQLGDGSPNDLAAQLNTVLFNGTLQGNSTNEFWTQNVILYSDRTDLLSFIDNLWDFSNPSLVFPSDALLNHSANGSEFGDQIYVGLGPVLNLTMPFTVDLYNNASVTDVTTTDGSNGSVTLPYDQLWFNYSVWKSGAWVAGGAYDWVVLNSQNLSAPLSVLPDPEFQVNGASLIGPGYIPDDAEWVLTGVAGGTVTSVDALNAAMNLWWWNLSEGAYQNVPSAYNFGSETGENLQGVATWYDGSDTVHLDAGPTLLTPLWNESPSSSPGFETISGTLTPSNAFIFLNTSTDPSTPLDPYWASWVPVPLSGILDVQVPIGNYTGVILLSNFDPVTFFLNTSDPASWNLTVSLRSDPYQGIYTPLIAWDNAQLAAISLGGDGSASDPYEIANDEYGALSGEFADLNEFDFALWPGILIAHTTAHVDINDAAPFQVNYEEVLEEFVEPLGLPLSNDLGIELYGTTSVSIVGAPLLTGWYSQYQYGFPAANVIAWNTSDTLVANNVFNSEGDSVLLFGGSGNVVSGNWFTQTYGSSYDNGLSPLGLFEEESGDTIYNNYFATSIGASSPDYSIYTETYYSSTAASFTDAWNVSEAPSGWVNLVNGYSLSGSIVGGTWIGGNFWLGFTGEIPWNDFGAIENGGDYLPLTDPTTSAYATLTFEASGLPQGTSWSVALNGVLSTSTTPWINVTLANGSYTFQVTPVAGFVVSPSSGTETLSGTAITVDVSFVVPTAGPWTVTFVELGLPAGTTWTVTLGGTMIASQLELITFAATNGSYPYSVTPPAAYVASPSSGTAVVAGADPDAVDVAMTPDLGWLAGVVTPTRAQVWVDGAEIPVNVTSGAFNVSEPVGTFALEATDAGYVAQFNNVTVAPAQSAVVAFTLYPTTSSAPVTSAFLAGMNGIAVAALGALLVIFFIATLYFAATRRPTLVLRPESPPPGGPSDATRGPKSP
jgi:thermopsin